MLTLGGHWTNMEKTPEDKKRMRRFEGWQKTDQQPLL